MKLYDFHKKSLKGIRKTIVIVAVVAVLAISLHAIGSMISLSHTIFAYANNSVKMTDQRIFLDSRGNLNVVGVVNNVDRVPISVTVGLNTTTANLDSSQAATTYFTKEPIYGRIIYPLTGAPFKF